jgi:hypothetical protein
MQSNKPHERACSIETHVFCSTTRAPCPSNQSIIIQGPNRNEKPTNRSINTNDGRSMAAALSRRLWEQQQPLASAILHHPFVRAIGKVRVYLGGGGYLP